jgi:protein-tyrosine phosphatase
MKIVMVCLGNICRSPLAEGILTSKAAEKGLPWQVDSAGTSAYHIGEKPDSRSVLVAQKNGIDISKQRARQFMVSDFDRFDLIYAMDTSNYNKIRRLARNDADKNKVLLILNEVYPNENRAVPDPYWDNDGFTKVFYMLEEACANIVEKYA